MAIPPSVDRADPAPYFLLHHEAHRSWADSKLVMWRMGFLPAYLGEEIADALDTVLGTFGVSSYAIYELLGRSDILLRAWMPATLDLTSFEDAVFKELLRHHMAPQELERNEVAEIHRHWVWCEPGSKDMRVPPSELLAQRPDDEYLRRLNNTLFGRLEGLEKSEVDDAVEKNLISPYWELEPLPEDKQQGIKFLMFIVAERLRVDLRRRFAGQIFDRLVTLSGKVEEEDGFRLLSELSLYETPHGESGDFIIFGRARPDKFYDAVPELIDFVVRPEYRGLFKLRPVTHILAAPNFSRFTDGIPVASTNASPDAHAGLSVDELLELGEGPDLETKASMYADVSHWLLGGENDAFVRGPTNYFFEGITRTITAFLNSPNMVGRLVVGAVRAESIDEQLQRRPSEDLARKLTDLPRVGSYWVTGVECDLELLRSEGSNQRGLEDLIAGAFELLAGQIDGIEDLAGRVIIEPETVKDRTLLVITVRSSAPDEWVYCRPAPGADEIFPVRYGTITQSLSRSDERTYREQFDS